MDSANLAVALDPPCDEPVAPAAQLRGTSRGLEMVVNGRATADEMAVALEERLDEAPGFFRGSDVRVAVEDGPLAAGCLARLDELAARFGLRIVSIAPRDPVPQPNLAAGSAPSAADFAEEAPTGSALTPLPPILPAAPAEPVMLAEAELTALVQLVEPGEVSFEEPTQTQIAAPIALAATPETALPPEAGPRLVVGPVRSGVILEHVGHVIVFGDVNPGAEVRASGSIVVLGRMRGTAHAGIGQDCGFILALRLEPQQLRIGRMVARAGDGDAPSDAEIAYATSEQIIVERYSGKLPRNLATSL
ncbi:MAG TPA: septum site-determining protein MinC [Kofleriaceae bacterium]|nr:septum site-determining protein MinC [Kofleriaceae bacterium]